MQGGREDLARGGRREQCQGRRRGRRGDQVGGGAVCREGVLQGVQQEGLTHVCG